MPQPTISVVMNVEMGLTIKGSEANRPSSEEMPLAMPNPMMLTSMRLIAMNLALMPRLRQMITTRSIVSSVRTISSVRPRARHPNASPACRRAKRWMMSASRDFDSIRIGELGRIFTNIGNFVVQIQRSVAKNPPFVGYHILRVRKKSYFCLIMTLKRLR